MTNMRRPKVPDDPPPVLTNDELRQLLKACEGTSFDDRRDMAIVRVFLDTGARPPRPLTDTFVPGSVTGTRVASGSGLGT